MEVIRYICMANGCNFCDDDEAIADRHSAQYGDSHDLLKVDYDPTYKHATVKVIDTNTISTTTS